MNDQTSTGLREEVRSKYAAAARAVMEPQAGASASCCGSSATDSCCGTNSAAEAVGGFSENLYREGETDGLPEEAVLASLGCGNPIAVADLHKGERVLDLGSGGGIDVLLSARRVGPAGKAYRLDMTQEMLDLTRTSARAAVFAESFRVLRPGGRLGIADILAENHLTAAQRLERGAQAGCIAGAPSFAEYRDGLARAGFTGITITPAHQAGDGLHSAIIRAAKP